MEDFDELEQAMQFKQVTRPLQIVKNLLKKDNVFSTGTINLNYDLPDTSFTFNEILLDNPSKKEDAEHIIFGGKIKVPTPVEKIYIQEAQDDDLVSNDLFISEKGKDDYYFLLFNSPKVRAYRAVTKLTNKELTIIKLLTDTLSIDLLFVSGTAKHYLAATFGKNIRKNYYKGILYLLSHKLLGKSYEIQYFTAGTDLDLLGKLQKVNIGEGNLDTTIELVTENSTISLLENSIKELSIELPEDTGKVSAMLSFKLNNGYLQVYLSQIEGDPLVYSFLM